MDGILAKITARIAKIGVKIVHLPEIVKSRWKVIPLDTPPEMDHI